MKLITEQVENVEYICEDVGGKKNYKIKWRLLTIRN